MQRHLDSLVSFEKQCIQQLQQVTQVEYAIADSLRHHDKHLQSPLKGSDKQQAMIMSLQRRRIERLEGQLNRKNDTAQVNLSSDASGDIESQRLIEGENIQLQVEPNHTATLLAKLANNSEMLAKIQAMIETNMRIHQQQVIEQMNQIGSQETAIKIQLARQMRKSEDQMNYQAVEERKEEVKLRQLKTEIEELKGAQHMHGEWEILVRDLSDECRAKDEEMKRLRELIKADSLEMSRLKEVIDVLTEDKKGEGVEDWRIVSGEEIETLEASLDTALREQQQLRDAISEAEKCVQRIALQSEKEEREEEQDALEERKAIEEEVQRSEREHYRLEREATAERHSEELAKAKDKWAIALSEATKKAEQREVECFQLEEEREEFRRQVADQYEETTRLRAEIREMGEARQIQVEEKMAAEILAREEEKKRVDETVKALQERQLAETITEQLHQQQEKLNEVMRQLSVSSQEQVLTRSQLEDCQSILELTRRQHCELEEQLTANCTRGLSEKRCEAAVEEAAEISRKEVEEVREQLKKQERSSEELVGSMRENIRKLMKESDEELKRARQKHIEDVLRLEMKVAVLEEVQVKMEEARSALGASLAVKVQENEDMKRRLAEVETGRYQAKEALVQTLTSELQSVRDSLKSARKREEEATVCKDSQLVKAVSEQQKELEDAREVIEKLQLVLSQRLEQLCEITNSVLEMEVSLKEVTDQMMDAKRELRSTQEQLHDALRREKQDTELSIVAASEMKEESLMNRQNLRVETYRSDSKSTQQRHSSLAKEKKTVNCCELQAGSKQQEKFIQAAAESEEEKIQVNLTSKLMDNAKKLIVQEPKTKAATAVDEDIMGTDKRESDDDNQLKAEHASIQRLLKEELNAVKLSQTACQRFQQQQRAAFHFEERERLKFQLEIQTKENNRMCEIINTTANIMSSGLLLLSSSKQVRGGISSLDLTSTARQVMQEVIEKESKVRELRRQLDEKTMKYTEIEKKYLQRQLKEHQQQLQSQQALHESQFIQDRQQSRRSTPSKSRRQEQSEQLFNSSAIAVMRDHLSSDQLRNQLQQHHPPLSPQLTHSPYLKSPSVGITPNRTLSISPYYRDLSHSTAVSDKHLSFGQVLRMNEMQQIDISLIDSDAQQQQILRKLSGTLRANNCFQNNIHLATPTTLLREPIKRVPACIQLDKASSTLFKSFAQSRFVSTPPQANFQF